MKLMSTLLLVSLFAGPAFAEFSNQSALELLTAKFEKSKVATPEIMVLSKKLLSTKDVEAKRAAANTINYYMGRYTSAQVLEIVLIELADKDTEVRQWGVSSFRHMRDLPEVESLMTHVLTNERDVETRRLVTKILRTFRITFAFDTSEVVKLALKDSDYEVKENALASLTNDASEARLLIAKEFEKNETDENLKQLARYVQDDIALMLKHK